MRALLFLLFILFTASCESPSQITHFEGIALTLPYHIQIGDRIRPNEEKIIEEMIYTTFKEIDETLNHWNPHSELSSLNHLPSHTPISLSPMLIDLLLIANTIVILSNGRYDPTTGKVIDLWKKEMQKGTIPSQDLLSILPVGWDNILITSNCCEKKEDLFLDFDGLAKGYAVDLLINRLKQAGFADLYIEWAGEIRCLGHHPQKRPWTIQLDKRNETITLNNEAIATSGNYQQVWTIDNKTYTHIINPQTKQALTLHPHAIIAVSVKAPTCALADGLATSGMLFDNVEEANKWVCHIEKIMPDVHFWITTS